MPNALDYTHLAYVDDLGDLDDCDRSCLSELHEVMSRCRRLTRVGISLPYKHFDMAEDEALVETSDSLNRILTIAPDIIAEYTVANYIQTVWRCEGYPCRHCVKVENGCQDHQ